ncbi:RNA cap guanine-N2 methyltransferase [Aureococcus anophagefferens]|nr:RNA cap guanine-N2 methyltransferase [Aureococcus anophagefferens]
MGDVQHDEPHKKHHHHRHASQPRPFAIVDIRSDDEPAHDASCEDTLSEYCVGARANPLQADAGTPAPARGRKTAVSLEVRGDAAAAAARAGAAAHRRLPRPVPGGRRVADDEPEGAPGGRGRGARERAGRARDALRARRAREVAVATLRRSLDRYDEAGDAWRFEAGDVVEVQGPDARWRLAVVTHGARGVYGVASNGGFTHGYGDDLLAPRVAAVVSRRGFGEAPFTWRAAAMVRLEERLQFMGGHRDDFERFGYEAWGRREFDYWLRDERNGAFRAQFEAAAPGARALGLCLEPRAHGGAEDWGIPVVVFLFEIRRGRGRGFPALCAGRAATVQDRGEGARFTSAMILLVVFFYAAKVAPDAYAKFLGDGAVAKLVALRALLFRSENDSALQKVGFRLYRTMNSGFDVVLYTLNLYLLFYHHSPLEVILNSLAIEFIRDLDETLNVDANNRYLKASAVEMVMRSYLPLRDLRRRLGVGDAALGLNGGGRGAGSTTGAHASSVALVSTSDVAAKLKSADERVDDMVEEYYGTFEGSQSFGWLASALQVRGYTTSGIFERYVIYRGDQWDAHLFPADAAAGGARLGGLPYDHLEGFENFPRFRAFAARGRAGDGAVIETACCRRLMMTADALVEVANAMVVLFGFPLVLLAVLAWVPLCYGPERSW